MTNKQAVKYQVVSDRDTDGGTADNKKQSRQESRTGSPTKKNSLLSTGKINRGDPSLETSLQNSNTPTLKDTKNLGLKPKLQQDGSQATPEAH